MKKILIPMFLVLPLILPMLSACDSAAGMRRSDFPKGSAIEMVSIPGGTFEMGDRAGKGYSAERPVHSVTLSPFYMSKTEITYARWKLVRDWAESHGYALPPGGMGSHRYDGKQDESHPVADVSWFNAVLWCNAASEMEGRKPVYRAPGVLRSGQVNLLSDWVDWAADGYRLPTEAEWEYAARAGTGTVYSFGDVIKTSDANWWDSRGPDIRGTTPAGAYAPNAWGFYDMVGNLSEWTWDWYDPLYYQSSPSDNPRGPASGNGRSVRGGDWSSGSDALRSSFRSYSSPVHDYYNIGFRVVRSR